jgi:TorA maturation chaperone TorD
LRLELLPSQADDQVRVAAALRDFFIAADAGHMAEAYTRLAEATGGEAPEPDDWEAIEFAFNELFVGPKAPLAPPYGSVYLEPEPQFMGPTTIQVRHLYGAMGLVAPGEGSFPDDHLSLELDAHLRIKAAMEGGLDRSEDGLHWGELWRYFLEDHLGVWVPLFAGRVRRAEGVPDPILFVVDQLTGWLEGEKSSLPPEGRITSEGD